MPIGSLRFWLPVCTLLGGLIAFVVIGINRGSFSGFLPILILLGILLLIVLINAFTEKVLLDEDGIHFKSLFRSISMAWDEVHSWGGFRASRVGNTQLDLKHSRKGWGVVLLYVSSVSTFDPLNASKARDGFLTMHFRPEFFAILQDRLGAPARP